MQAILFVAAQVSVVAFGLPAAFHPALRGSPLPARVAAAFGTGAVALAIEAMLFSILGIRWSVVSLGLPLFAASVGISVWWSRRPFPRERYPAAARTVVAATATVMGLALVHLVLSLATARATSADFVLIWGVKAARFAAARGIDAELLGSAFSHHLAPDYPPLLPIVLAWSTLVTGELSWQIAPTISAFWMIAAIPIVVMFLRRRVPAAVAAAGAAFWTVALAISIVYSASGGNADAPLLFFETVALAALLGERPKETDASRFVAAWALAGAAMTKVEGSVAVVLILMGVALRDRRWRRPHIIRGVIGLGAAPLFCLALWFSHQAVRGLTIGYRTHGDLLVVHARFLTRALSAMVLHLQAGTAWLSWLIPLGFLAACTRRARLESEPALLLVAGLLAFFLFDYLHDPMDPSIRIGWTLPRISQPALSALILAAGVASASRVPVSRLPDPAERRG